MKKQKKAVLIAMVLATICFVGCGKQTEEAKQDDVQKTEIRTFADWTEQEVFQEVPAMLAENTRIGDVVDYGGKNYVISVDGSSLADYQEYLNLLEENGFVLYSDNGESGLDNAVYTATYTKENIVLTITYLVNLEKTTISACDGLVLSEHLKFSDSYVANNIEGAETKLHMKELFDFGDCFIIQLKNGHFIVHDGGIKDDAKYLCDYLDSLTQTGDKPIIEAWFISHAHEDHVGALQGITETGLGDRFYVEGIYFNEPSLKVAGTYGGNARGLITSLKTALRSLKTTEGKTPVIYRPETGQRYYFNDLSIDIVMSQEQLLFENYSGDYNDTSTWFMYNIEGQKLLISADGDLGAMANIMRTYSREYLEVDIATAPHHSYNTWNEFTDYCTVNTVLVPAQDWQNKSENEHLKEACVEWYIYGDGTKIFTFPYKIGTAESVPNAEWKYHSERVFSGGK